MAKQTDISEVLTDIIEQLSNLEDEKAAIAGRMKEILAMAKVQGWKPPILRQMVKEYRMATVDRYELYNDLDAYRMALGLLADTPLGIAAIQRKRDADPAPPGGDENVMAFPGDVPAPSGTSVPAAG